MDDHRKSIFEFENQAELYKRLRPVRKYDLSVNERGTLYYWWSIIVSICCVYNLLFMTFLVFEDIKNRSYDTYLIMNAISDSIYILDMAVQSRRSYYENGCKMIEPSETRWFYLKSYRCLFDVLSILPTDLGLMKWENMSLLRLNRLCKCYRLSDMFNLAQRRHKYQGLITFSKIVITCTLMFHWNACAFYVLSTISLDIANKTRQEFDQDDWPFNFWKITDAYVSNCKDFRYQTCGFDETGRDITAREQYVEELFRFWQDKRQRIRFSNFSKEYSLSMYWSSLTMTTLGEQPNPNLTFQNVFEIFDTLIGMIVFAMIMGSVGDLVSSANAIKTEIQLQMDGLKQYMQYRNLDHCLQERVLKYCEYEMSKQQSIKESVVRTFLPQKLFIQVNKFLQWRTLKQSPLFEGCEISFLSDLAAKMETFSYGPGDVVAAKGDLNKEMLVVSTGELRVIDEFGEVLRVMKEGEIYGEQQLIWLPDHKYGNRRVNNVYSFGYSDVYLLHRDDLLHLLTEYPATKTSIYNRARIILANDGEIESFYQEGDGDDLKPLEEVLREVEVVVRELEQTLNKQRILFNKSSSSLKKRVFSLETIFCQCHAEIRRDTSGRRSLT